MKINPNQQVELGQEQRAKPKVEESQEFANLLTKELGRNEQSSTTAEVQRPGGMSAAELQTVLATQSVNALGTGEVSESVIMEHIDGVLAQWENYADQLQSPQQGKDLRNLYGMLEGLTGSVTELKEKWSQLDSSQPRLGELIDELEVLAVT